MAGTGSAVFYLRSTVNGTEVSFVLPTENQALYLVVGGYDPDGHASKAGAPIEAPSLQFAGSLSVRWLRSPLAAPWDFSAQPIDWRTIATSLWTPIAGVSSFSYTPTDSDVRRYLRAEIQYLDQAGNLEVVYATSDEIIDNINDVPQSTLQLKTSNDGFLQGQEITVTGTLYDNDFLSERNVAEVPFPDTAGVPTVWQRSYQWFADGKSIEGAITATFTPGQSEVGKRISLQISYMDPDVRDESVEVFSPKVIVNVNDKPLGSVALDLDLAQAPTENSTLQANAELVDIDGLGPVAENKLSWQWYADSSLISGAVGKSITLSSSLIGKKISVEAIYTDIFTNTIERVRSAQTLAVLDVDNAASGSLSVSGLAKQKESVSIAGSIGDPDGVLDSGYRWFRLIGWDEVWENDGLYLRPKLSLLANSKTIILQESDVGETLIGEFYYRDKFGNKAIQTDLFGPIADFDDPPIGTVIIQGVSKQGQTLTAVPAFTDLDGIDVQSYEFRWLINGKTVDDPELLDTSGTSLQLTQDAVGKKIEVEVSYTDLRGNSAIVKSSQTPAVSDVDDLPQGALNILKDNSDNWIYDGLRQGDVLSVDTSQIVDLDNPIGSKPKYSVAWFLRRTSLLSPSGFVDTQVTSGLDGTLTLSASHVGGAVWARASYTDAAGNRGEVSSAPTSAILNENDPPTASVTFSALPIEGKEVRANVRITDLDYSTVGNIVPAGDLIFQWLSDGFPIENAEHSAFTPSQSEVGKRLSVQVSYLDPYESFEIIDPVYVGTVLNSDDPPSGTIEIIRISSFELPTQGDTLQVFSDVTDPDIAGGVPQDWSWRWFADGKQTGTGAPELSLDQSHVGKLITLEGRYSDEFGHIQTLTATLPGAIRDLDDPSTNSLWVSGVTKSNEVLQGGRLSIVGTVEDIDGIKGPLTFRWFSNDQPISSNFTNTLTVPNDMAVGSEIRAEAVFSDSFGETLIDFGPYLVLGVDDGIGVLEISGTLRQGEQLHAIIQDPDEITQASFNWVSIDLKTGARSIFWSDGDKVVLDETLVGKSIEVTADYADSSGVQSTVIASTGAGTVQNVNSPPVPGGIPEIIVVVPDTEYVLQEGDTLIQGARVSIDTSKIIDPDNDYTPGYSPEPIVPSEIQWLIDGSPIPGATSPELDIGQSLVRYDPGKGFLSVRVSYVDSRGTFESVTSSEFQVQNANDLPEGEMRIIGDPRVGSTLFVQNHLRDLDGISRGIEFSWYASDIKEPLQIGGDSFWVSPDLIGKTISVTAKWKDDGGVEETFPNSGAEAVALSSPVSGFSLQGQVYHWRSLALMNDVQIFWTGDGSSPQAGEAGGMASRPLSLKGIRRDQGELHAELWFVAAQPVSGGINFALQSSDGLIDFDAATGLASSVQTESGSMRVSFEGGFATDTLLGTVSLKDDSEQIISVNSAKRIRVEDFTANGGLNSSDFSFQLGELLTGSSGAGVGTFEATDLDFGRYQLTAHAAMPTNGAITSSDLLATLKIALGRNPNPDPDGAGPQSPMPVSPFQRIAADFNGDGVVNHSDITSLAQFISRDNSTDLAEWVFVGETSAATAGLLVDPDNSLPSNLIAVLRGDVDGSWAALDSGALETPKIGLDYIEALMETKGIPANYFGNLDFNLY